METLLHIQKAKLFIERALRYVINNGVHKSKLSVTDTPLVAERKWTANVIELVEIIYGMCEMECVNNGAISIHELATDLSGFYGIEVKDCYSAYTDMKRRKGVSRTYFLDKMRERLNIRMDNDDEQEKLRR